LRPFIPLSLIVGFSVKKSFDDGADFGAYGFGVSFFSTSTLA